MSSLIKVGIIGGTGLDDPEILESPSEISIKTPFGLPSSFIQEGKIKGIKVAILPRHGREHTILPSNINFRANIWSLKDIDCTHILASTAVGSLREKIKPGDIIFPDQFIDFTKNRPSTFFDKDEIRHTPMDEPFCPKIIETLSQITSELNISHHTKKTVVTVEGPRFSSKSESLMFRSLGADIINMSTCPEVVLAKELDLPYGVLAMATDYDCWKEDEEPVSYELIQENLKENASKVLKILINALPLLK